MTPLVRCITWKSNRMARQRLAATAISANGLCIREALCEAAPARSDACDKQGTRVNSPVRNGALDE